MRHAKVKIQMLKHDHFCRRSVVTASTRPLYNWRITTGRMKYADSMRKGVTGSPAHNMPPTAARDFDPQPKLVLNLPTSRGWKDECTKERCPGLEPRALASEASVMPLGHLLPNSHLCDTDVNKNINIGLYAICFQSLICVWRRVLEV